MSGIFRALPHATGCWRRRVLRGRSCCGPPGSVFWAGRLCACRVPVFSCGCLRCSVDVAWRRKCTSFCVWGLGVLRRATAGICDGCGEAWLSVCRGRGQISVLCDRLFIKLIGDCVYGNFAGFFCAVAKWQAEAFRPQRRHVFSGFCGFDGDFVI